MITPKQLRVLRFIDHTIRISGVSPTFREISDALGLGSKGGVHAMVNHLMAAGFVRCEPHKRRSLTVIRMPPTATTDGEQPALSALREAHESGKGCYLTAEMVAALGQSEIGRIWETLTSPR